MIGRYAPSPSGDLHVGNLRTAMLAWLFAHAGGSTLRLRIDDLDPRLVDSPFEERQLADLAAIGVTVTGTTLWQSTRGDAYAAALAELEAADLVYPCFCSRREIREAVSAPHEHLPDGAYPGTCRELTAAERTIRAESRPAARRVRADAIRITFDDGVHGKVTATVDDFVVQRNDGVAAYNLASVLDDHLQKIEQVVRGDDLLSGTARQIWLRERLGLDPVDHAHVPLVVGAGGERLAKRDGAVTREQLADIGIDADRLRDLLARSAGLGDVAGRSMSDLLDDFDPRSIPTAPTNWDEIIKDELGQKNASDSE